MKFISIKQLHLSLLRLQSWGEVVGQQSSHATVYLAGKAKGMNSKGPIEFRDPEDENYFWNTYMRIRGDRDPFFDPFVGKFRPRDYPHNTAFKQRNDRWTSPDYNIANRDADQWQFTDTYIANLITKPFKSQKIPLVELASWLFRNDSFDDNANSQTLIEKFLNTFSISIEELNGLFELRQLREVDEKSIFHHKRPTDALLRELVRRGDQFSLDEADEMLAEIESSRPPTAQEVARLLLNISGQVILQGPPGTGKLILRARPLRLSLGRTTRQLTSPATSLNS